MVEHINFYENMKEALLRLQGTVVVYDNVPHFIITIGDNASDGIFRVYMEKTGGSKGNIFNHSIIPIPYNHPDPKVRGDQMDEFMEKYPNYNIIRKQMNSPMFNRFRPFPLGMANHNGGAMYVQRQPQRHTQQGLTDNMLKYSVVTLDDNPNKPTPLPDVFSESMRRTIMNEYPPFEDCVNHVMSEDFINKSAAFHRDFAVLSGPVDTLFLQYMTDVIGYLPYHDRSRIVLSKKFRYAKEAVEDLRLFQTVTINPE